MLKSWSSFVLSLLSIAVPAGATIEQKRVEIRLGADGRFEEEIWLDVRLESREEVERWSLFPIALDVNRELELASGSIVAADGSRRRIDPAESDTLDWAGEGTAHSSTSFRLLDFGGADVGSRLSVHYRVRVQPYFPGGLSVLSADSEIESLSVDLRCAGSPCRWALHGPHDGVESAETAEGVRVEGALPAHAGEATLLRFAWGEQGGWGEVARWYSDLVADLTPDAGVGRRALELTAGAPSPRDRLARLLDEVRSTVRYVAVEVGVGGYRPTAPAEVAARRWGDCKDKAFLLLDQLEAVGIAAHPALVLSAHEQRVERDFASPDQFNHLIVAVDQAAVETRPGDPVAGGYLFVDPTLSRGGLRWLHPSTQGQHALVVREGGGELVEIPVLPEQDVTRLEAALTIDARGTARGLLKLGLSGVAAIELLESASDEERAESVRRALRRWLPAAELTDLAWDPGEPDAVPSVAMSAAAVVPGWLQEGATSLRLPGLPALPDRHRLGQARVALRPRRIEALWRLGFTEARCQVAAAEVGLDNGVGSFGQKVGSDHEGSRVTRISEVSRRWLDTPELLASGLSLAEAERTTLRRRIRLECTP